MYFTYRDENRTFAEIGFWGDGGETLTRADGTERVRSLRVTHGAASGARRAAACADAGSRKPSMRPAAEGPDPIILSYAFAQSRFGGDAAALGRELLDQWAAGASRRHHAARFPVPRYVAAVRRSSSPCGSTLPEQPSAASAFTRSRDSSPASLRPRPAPTLQRMLPIWLDAWPMVQGFSVTREAIENWRITPVVRPLKDDMVGGIASALWVLMGAIGAVLLVACANIANLMLVRADARRPELAVRAALGAVPARIARELLVESLVIGAIGGALGLALAYGGLELLVAIGPSNLPRLDEIAVHPPVLAFTVAVSLASTLAFGSITALKHALHVDMSAFGGARGSSASRERSTTRNALVVVQVALALVLVVSAVLMIRTFQALRDVDPGFADPATIQTVRTWAPNELIRDPTQFVRVQHEILDAIAALPGVASAGFTSALPMEGRAVRQQLRRWSIEGRPLAAGDAPPPRRMKLVSPGYFETMGTRIIAGRDITWADIEAGGRVAAHLGGFRSRARARARGRARANAFERPSTATIGARSSAWCRASRRTRCTRKRRASCTGRRSWRTRSATRRSGTRPWRSWSAATARARRASATRSGEAVWSVNRDVPIALERTMQDLYAGSLARTSFALVMLAIAGSMALALGSSGSTASSPTSSRNGRERSGSGWRSARSAARFERCSCGRVLRSAPWASAIGLVAALALTRLMSSLLFGIEPTDVVTYVAAVGVILAAAALASYLPARRASAIDPVETLKAE